MLVGHIQIILSDHVSLKIRNIFLLNSIFCNLPRVTRKQFLIDIDDFLRGIVTIEIHLSLTRLMEITNAWSI